MHVGAGARSLGGAPGCEGSRPNPSRLPACLTPQVSQQPPGLCPGWEEPPSPVRPLPQGRIRAARSPPLPRLPSAPAQAPTALPARAWAGGGLPALRVPAPRLPARRSPAEARDADAGRGPGECALLAPRTAARRCGRGSGSGAVTSRGGGTRAGRAPGQSQSRARRPLTGAAARTDRPPAGRPRSELHLLLEKSRPDPRLPVKSGSSPEPGFLVQCCAPRPRSHTFCRGARPLRN